MTKNEFNTLLLSMDSGHKHSVQTLKWTKILLFCIFLSFPIPSKPQPPPQPRQFWELPTACVSAHDVGKLVLGVSNKGYFGNTTLTAFYKCINADYYYIGCEYPKKSGISLLGYGSIWIGGVRGGDTLVSEGFMGGFWEVPGFHEHPPWSEFNASDPPDGEFAEKSLLKNTEHYDITAISDQDLIC
ncbi:MAG: hypothetical protein ACREBV_02405, partial [Candidatus Zixiibacteriota bacterium]